MSKERGLRVGRWLRAGVLLMFASAFMWRCANISSPQGGPKDSLPPIIVSATPGFGTTNFTGKEIYIGFNEYVVIKDQQKEFFTSPMMKRSPSNIRNRQLKWSG